MDCPEETAKLFLTRFTEISVALKYNDMSLAQFPRTGNEARIELQSKLETLQWVLEMLNIKG